jgi:hypothetical protein
MEQGMTPISQVPGQRKPRFLLSIFYLCYIVAAAWLRGTWATGQINLLGGQLGI